jgi:hypothetical protein
VAPKKLLSPDKPEDQFFNIPGWVKYYEENKKLPHNAITCKECRRTATSMFGSNLKNTLPKFSNDIEALLKGFVCRPCRTIKSANEKAKMPKPEKLAKVSKEVVPMTWEEMEDYKEEIRKNIPKIDLTRKPTPITPDSKEQVQHMTATACVRPDIHLNNGRYCNGCPWIKHCICKLKRISEKEIAVSKKRR